MADQKTFGVLIVLFLGIIVVLALMPSIAEQTNTMTEKFTVYNVSLDVNGSILANSSGNTTFYMYTTPKQAGWKITDCPISNLVVRNGSNDTLVLNTDYTANLSLGRIAPTGACLNWNSTGVYGSNISRIDYTYCEEGYITSSAGRSITKMILLFAALGLLVFAIYYSVRQFT